MFKAILDMFGLKSKELEILVSGAPEAMIAQMTNE